MWVGRRTGCGEVRQDAGEAGVWGSHLALPLAGSCLHGGHSPVPLLPSKKKKSFQSGLPGVHQQTGAGKAVALLSATRQLYAREAWGARSHVILTLQLK